MSKNIFQKQNRINNVFIHIKNKECVVLWLLSKENSKRYILGRRKMTTDGSLKFKNSKGQKRGKYVGKFIQHLLNKARMSNFKELKCRGKIKGHNSGETK